MEFSLVLFLLILACLLLGILSTALNHLRKRWSGIEHHNRREDHWYWERRTPRPNH